MEPRLRASPDQFAVLVEFMERHGDIARPQLGVQGRLRADRLWITLTSAVNLVRGGVKKPLERWKKVWADFKAKTKKKSFTFKKNANGNTGRPRLTSLEKRVLTLMGLLTVNSQKGVEEPSINGASQPDSDLTTLQEPSMFLNIEVGDVPPTSSTTQNAQPQAHPPTIQCNKPHTNEITPQSLVRSIRRQLLRRRPQTLYNQTANGFMAVELRRLRLEGIREQNFHQREIERLRLEALRLRWTGRMLEHYIA